MSKNKRNQSRSVLPKEMSDKINALKTLFIYLSDCTELAMLLGVNCGLTMDRMAVLRDCNIDWKAKRLYRQAGLTVESHEECKSLLSFPLWPESFALLQRIRSKDRLKGLRPLWKYKLSTNPEFTRPCPKYEPIFPYPFQLPVEPFHMEAAKVLWNVERYREVVSLYLQKSPWKSDFNQISRKQQSTLNDAIVYLRWKIRLDVKDEIKKHLEVRRVAESAFFDSEDDASD